MNKTNEGALEFISGHNRKNARFSVKSKIGQISKFTLNFESGVVHRKTNLL